MTTYKDRYAEEQRNAERARVELNQKFWLPFIKAAEETGLWDVRVKRSDSHLKDDDGNPMQRISRVEFFIDGKKVGVVYPTPRSGYGYRRRDSRRYRIQGLRVPNSQRYTWGDGYRDYKLIPSAIKSMKEWFRADTPEEVWTEYWRTDQRKQELDEEVRRAEWKADELRRWFQYRGSEIALHVLEHGKLDDVSAAKAADYKKAEEETAQWKEERADYKRRLEAQYWDFQKTGKAKAITDY